VIIQVVRPGKSSVCPLTLRVNAQERFVPVTMESVGFSFMSQQAGRGRELHLFAVLDPAAEWLQVRVEMFTNCSAQTWFSEGVEGKKLTDNCTLV